MPRHVRNFWIDLNVDGRKRPVATGPASSGGEFFQIIKIRDNGSVSDERLFIYGRVEPDDTLAIEISIDDGDSWHRLLETKR